MGTVKFVGKTEDDAVAKAAHELGIAPSDVSYKIVSRSTGLLGLLNQTVTVEVTLGARGNVREEEPPVSDAQPIDDPEPPREEGPVHEPKEQRPREQRPREQRPREQRPREQRPREQRSRDQRPRDQRDSRRKRKPRRDPEERAEQQVVDEKIIEEKMARAQELMTELVRLMGGEAQVRVQRNNAEIGITLLGQLPGWLGRGQSRTIESLQFLANKIVNRFPPRYRVVLHVEGQREERLEKLEAAALELGRRVEESGQSAWLAPMSAKERRIVHLAVAAVKGLGTKSIGDGDGRRVCIYRIDESKAEALPEEPAEMQEESPVEALAEEPKAAPEEAPEEILEGVLETTEDK